MAVEESIRARAQRVYDALLVVREVASLVGDADEAGASELARFGSVVCALLEPIIEEMDSVHFQTHPVRVVA